MSLKKNYSYELTMRSISFATMWACKIASPLITCSSKFTFQTKSIWRMTTFSIFTFSNEKMKEKIWQICQKRQKPQSLFSTKNHNDWWKLYLVQSMNSDRLYSFDSFWLIQIFFFREKRTFLLKSPTVNNWNIILFVKWK